MHLSDFRIAELDLPKNADEIKVKSITSDSRSSSEDCMFIAIKGNSQDGHNFIDEAISAGASNVLVDYKYKNDTKIPVSKSKNVRRALALISAIYYNDQPDTIAAVTGTNGKTSVCSFFETNLGNK
jgi:UDP-N-acetylmuramoyl-L-alanyl-D-glutamate--2,6-diaminopimelate ligase